MNQHDDAPLRFGEWDAIPTEDRRLLLSRYRGRAEELELPAELGGIPVAGLARYALFYHEELRIVRLPEGMEVIGEAAFARCTGLTDVFLPGTIRQISKNAFRDAGRAELHHGSPEKPE